MLCIDWVAFSFHASVDLHDGGHSGSVARGAGFPVAECCRLPVPNDGRISILDQEPLEFQNFTVRYLTKFELTQSQLRINARGCSPLGQTNSVPPLITDLPSMTTIAPPQRPSSRDGALHLIPEFNFNGEQQFGYPNPPTAHELMVMWPTLAPQIPHTPGSSLFHSQERAFFSRDNAFFRIQIDTDPPQTNQAMGGPYRQDKSEAQADPPQLSAIPRQQPPQPPSQQPSPSSSSCSVSPPSQHQSPSECQRTQPPPQPTKPRHSRTITILPVAAGPPKGHQMGQYQVSGHHSHYPYPPPGSRHKSPMTVDDDAWQRPMPYSERRRAGKGSRRKDD